MKTEYNWIEDPGISICYLTEKNNVYIGVAECSEQDQDMKSKLTGSRISFLRAYIDRCKTKLQKLTEEHKTLTNFYKSIKDCKYYNENHQIETILMKKIGNLETEINYYDELLDFTKYELNAFLNEKAKLYKKLRENRQRGKQE